MAETLSESVRSSLAEGQISLEEANALLRMADLALRKSTPGFFDERGEPHRIRSITIATSCNNY